MVKFKNKTCIKQKCKSSSCGPRNLKAVYKFITSKQFFTYYILVFIFFVMLRLFKIPYKTDTFKNKYGCKAMFALGSLIQFAFVYVLVLITYFFLTLLLKFIKLIIKISRKIIVKRRRRPVLNFFIRLGWLIVLTILIYILYKLIQIYTTILYYTLGTVMGYTSIGSNNNCIIDKNKK
jgi:hypothetical protein